MEANTVKRAVLCCMILVAVLLFSSMVLSFGDPILEIAVKLELARIGTDDLLQITDLNLGNLGISTLAGMGQLKNLRTLDLRENPISDLTPISSLSKLRSLNLRETRVIDISPIKNFVQLEYLNLHSTNVKDVTVLQDLTNLHTLIMRNVYIGDQIHFLDKLTRLTRLNIRNTGVTDLSVLGELMSEGALQDNKYTGVEAEVDIRDNPISAEPGSDGYEVIRPYWRNIALRSPLTLPELTTQLIYINEVMSSNGRSITDRDGNRPDWIELFNPNNEDIDLSGCYLSDDWDQLDKWTFPQGTVMKANGYLLVFASGKDFSGQGEYHTNFSINALGEPIFLLDADKELIDFLPPVEIPRDISYGRFPDGASEFLYFTIPTPNRKNQSVGSYQ